MYQAWLNKMASYETFAKIYDEVMDDQLYEEWLAFTKRHLPENTKRILELACGTGILSVKLAQAGFDVTGLDLSSDMVELAKKREAEFESGAKFIEGDMLELSDDTLYDAVTCYSDSLCYMPDKEALLQAFAGVYLSLKENGQFIFDVHSIYQIEELFKEYSYHYQTDEFAFLWESYPGEVDFSVEHFLTFFVQDEKDEKFTRFDELHEERTYPIETYRELLEQVGFKSVEVLADFTDGAPEETSKRWFFVCHK